MIGEGGGHDLCELYWPDLHANDVILAAILARSIVTHCDLHVPSRCSQFATFIMFIKIQIFFVMCYI